MAAGFEYFTSDDVGAPVLQRGAGKFIALLDWVLVSKGGWTKNFTGTNLAAYRSATGNRNYLRVDDTQSGTTRFRGYRTMSAISTGTSQFPTATQSAGNINYFQTCKTSEYDYSNGPQRYWGVRTDKFVIIFWDNQPHSSPAYSYIKRSYMAFGDFPSYIQSGDIQNTILVADNLQTNNPYTGTYIHGRYLYNGLTTGTVSATNVFTAVSGSMSGTVVSPLSILHYDYFTYSDLALNSVNLTDTLFYSPISIGTVNSATDTSQFIIPRGRVPYMYSFWGGIYTPTSSIQDLVPFTRDGKTFLPIMDNTAADYTAVPPVHWSLAFLLEISDTDPDM